MAITALYFLFLVSLVTVAGNDAGNNLLINQNALYFYPGINGKQSVFLSFNSLLISIVLIDSTPLK